MHACVSQWSWWVSVWRVCFDWREACLLSWCSRKQDGHVSQRYRFEFRRGEWALFPLIPSALSLSFSDTPPPTQRRSLQTSGGSRGRAASPAMHWHHIHAFGGILLQNFFAITIFTWGSLWVEMLFFLLLFVQIWRFPRCTYSELSLSIPCVAQNKKKLSHAWTLISADSLTLHAKPLHSVPVIFSPKPFLDQLWRSTVRLQRSLAKIHIMKSLLSTTECRKSTKTASKLHTQGHSGPQRSNKITRTSTLTGRPRARTLSSSTSAAVFSIAGAHPALCFYPPQFTVVKETWQPVLPVYTSQRQPKKSHMVYEPWPSNMHAACAA